MRRGGLLTGLVLVGAAAAGCETIPHTERVAAYEQMMRDRFVGQSADTLVIQLGPPHSTYTLSDGREVFQYAREERVTGGGDSYTSYETATRTREFRDADGTVRQVEERQSIPVTRTNPVYTRVLSCTRRFVIDQNDTVEAFSWDGNACF